MRRRGPMRVQVERMPPGLRETGGVSSEPVDPLLDRRKLGSRWRLPTRCSCDNQASSCWPAAEMRSSTFVVALEMCAVPWSPQLCERQWREQVNMSLFLGSILNVLYAVLRILCPLISIRSFTTASS
ncbi:hypothetical protein KCU99_g328, partial [Aureobasidium melanogenum]